MVKISDYDRLVETSMPVLLNLLTLQDNRRDDFYAACSVMMTCSADVLQTIRVILEIGRDEYESKSEAVPVANPALLFLRYANRLWVGEPSIQLQDMEYTDGKGCLVRCLRWGMITLGLLRSDGSPLPQYAHPAICPDARDFSLSPVRAFRAKMNLVRWLESHGHNKNWVRYPPHGVYSFSPSLNVEFFGIVVEEEDFPVELKVSIGLEGGLDRSWLDSVFCPDNTEESICEEFRRFCLSYFPSQSDISFLAEQKHFIPENGMYFVRCSATDPEFV